MSKRLLKTAFPDELIKVQSRFKDRSKVHESSKDWSDELLFGFSKETINSSLSSFKKTLFSILVLGLFFALFLRLFHLQIINGSQNRDLADSNRIQIKVIHAPRGVIYDRNGIVLAQNEPGFRLVATGSGQTKYISREDALKMEITNDPNLKNLEVDHLRSYPNLEKTAHVLGYVSEITQEEMKQEKFRNYKLGDKIGRGGVEEFYEKILKGVDGGEVIEVDSSGKKIRTLRQTAPIPGNNIILAVEKELQIKLYDALKNQILKNKLSDPCCGAAVASNPSTGEVLALVSYPSFNPGELSEALINENSPLLNRAIGGVYPPGSTFKIVSSLAGLQSGKITPQTLIEDTGVMMLGPYSFANWYFTEYGKVEGMVDIKKALQRSNDIYFYKLGQLIGEEILAEYSRRLSLAKRVGIDMPGEEEGVIADGAWKEKNLGIVWYPGDTLHTAIGQGFTLTTPIQISNLISIIATRGKEYPIHLVSRITGPDNKVIKQFNFEPKIIKDIDPKNFEIVRESLSLVPKDGGTAWPFFNFTVQTAGKTGTAEFGDPNNRTHAWYTSFAPYDEPRIALTVLIEAGGEGSTEAGMVSKDVYQWYFSQNKSRPESLETSPVATGSARTLGE